MKTPQPFPPHVFPHPDWLSRIFFSFLPQRIAQARLNSPHAKSTLSSRYLPLITIEMLSPSTRFKKSATKPGFKLKRAVAAAARLSTTATIYDDSASTLTPLAENMGPSGTSLREILAGRAGQFRKKTTHHIAWRLSDKIRCTPASSRVPRTRRYQLKGGVPPKHGTCGHVPRASRLVARVLAQAKASSREAGHDFWLA